MVHVHPLWAASLLRSGAIRHNYTYNASEAFCNNVCWTQLCHALVVLWLRGLMTTFVRMCDYRVPLMIYMQSICLPCYRCVYVLFLPHKRTYQNTIFTSAFIYIWRRFILSILCGVTSLKVAAVLMFIERNLFSSVIDVVSDSSF